jgi:D-serine deaminase-like pyridoxal phosphate-dependent protein
VVDSWEGASTIDAAVAGVLKTLIDVNVGQDRRGVALEDALALDDRIRDLDRLRLMGAGIRRQPSTRARPGRSEAGLRCLDGSASPWRSDICAPPYTRSTS